MKPAQCAFYVPAPCFADGKLIPVKCKSMPLPTICQQMAHFDGDAPGSVPETSTSLPESLPAIALNSTVVSVVARDSRGHPDVLH